MAGPGKRPESGNMARTAVDVAKAAEVDVEWLDDMTLNGFYLLRGDER